MALAIVLAVVSALTGGYASPISNFFGAVFRPLQSAILGLTDGVASYYGYIYEFDAIQAENEQLRLQIARMEESARLSQKTNEENERLRKMLGLSERRRDLTVELCGITSWDSSNWASTFTINRGAADGIDPYDCVMTEENFMVGYVSRVEAHWSTVTTVIDTDMEAGAVIFRTGQTGVAEGNFDAMRQGLLQMTYLPKDIDLQIGDLVMTSGIGGVYPGELVLGTVTEVRTAETGISMVASVTPAVDFSRLKQVFVVKEFDISE